MITKTFILHDSFSGFLPSSCKAESCAFFDIETTGLYWKRSHIYLIGMIRMDNGCWTLTQWFAQRPLEEQLLLQEFTRALRGIRTLIHFNGNTFDIPYIRKKFLLYQLSDPLEFLDSLDLYREVNFCRKWFHLPSFKQKDAEKLVGFSRNDRYSGKELISLYQEYLTCADVHLLDFLLLHNQEDLTGMLSLLSLLSYRFLTEGDFSLASSVLDGNKLHLSFQLSAPVPVPLALEQESWNCRCCRDTMDLTLHGIHTVLKYFFPDYKDYYYLPLEDTAIHKSVAFYVDKEHRQRAKASNCYQKQQGLFFPQPTEVIQPAFRQDYKSLPLYFLWSEKNPPASDLLEHLAAAVLDHFRENC